MNLYRLCRLSTSDGELELAGPPAALRALALLLRGAQGKVEAQVSGGAVVQEPTEGPLTVSLRGEDMLHLAGGRRYLDIVWDALDGVAEQAEAAEDRGVSRHQHIEYLPPDDEYRSPVSVPLIIVSDRPEAALQPSDAPALGHRASTHSGRRFPRGAMKWNLLRFGLRTTPHRRSRGERRRRRVRACSIRSGRQVHRGWRGRFPAEPGIPPRIARSWTGARGCNRPGPGARPLPGRTSRR